MGGKLKNLVHLGGVTVTPAMRDEIDQFAAEAGVRRTEAVRRLFAAGLRALRSGRGTCFETSDDFTEAA